MGTVATRQPSSTAMIRVIALLPCLAFVSAFPSKLNSIGHNNHHSHHDHDEDVAASRSIARRTKVAAPTAAPIAIPRSSNTGPLDGNYAYSFETENGISQSVEGRMKMVDETPVYVMKGEYEYPGADGQMWKVEWYADETGYHPSAPFLPKSVVPNHPEVAAAVEAQLRFAAEEEAAAASINEVYVLPEDNGLAGYGTEDDLLLAGYGEQDEALDAYTTSYGRF